MVTGIPQVKKFYDPTDPIGQQKQSNLTDIVGYLSKVPLLTAIFGTVVDPSTATTSRTIKFLKPGIDVAVNHGLGRAFSGWEVVRRNYPGDFYESPQASSTDPSKVVLLRYQPSLFTPINPSVPMTVSVMVW